MSERKPEFLHNVDDQVAWVPVESQRFDIEAGHFVPCEVTRGQAKQSALHDITSCYDWTTLRCTKVWMAWDSEWYDAESHSNGCWVEVPKGSADARPYWRVEEMDKA